MGELSLDGSLQPIRGALLLPSKPKKRVLKVFSSKANVKEAAIVTGLDVYGVENVQEVIDFRRKRNFRTNNIDTRAEFIRI
jgi:magnesium chelatase family protein